MQGCAYCAFLCQAAIHEHSLQIHRQLSKFCVQVFLKLLAICYITLCTLAFKPLQGSSLRDGAGTSCSTRCCRAAARSGGECLPYRSSRATVSIAAFSDTVHWHMQAYASNYTGHAKVNRLIFIASKTAGTPLELEALRLAAEQLRKVIHLPQLVCGTCALC